MSSKISLRKLAAELGLSPATVYRALSGYPNVSLRTRREVLGAAQRAGYRLPLHENGNVAVIIPHFSGGSYLVRLLSFLEAEIHLRGFRMLAVSQTDIALLGDRMFDGVVSLVWTKGFEKLLPRIFSLPTVVLNASGNPLEGIPNIRSDQPQGIRLALEYLRSRGCRRIFYISTPEVEHVPAAAERLAAFRQFCFRTGQDYDALHLEVSSRGVRAALPFILAAEPDACFCADETLAAKVGQQLKAAGKRIPEDLSLMGLEDDYANEIFTPPITAIRQNFELLAATAADRIAAACRDRIPPRDALIPFSLIERDSVRKPENE